MPPPTAMGQVWPIRNLGTACRQLSRCLPARTIEALVLHVEKAVQKEDQGQPPREAQTGKVEGRTESLCP